MWRVQGFVGRVLHRCNTPLRLSQSHHVEDEVINTSSVLSTSRQSSDCSSQKAEDGERRRKKKTFHFTNAGLPRYTALDAVGWGAAAVLFMQLCRRIHSQFSTSSEPSPSAGALTVPPGLHKCGYRILLEILSRRDVLPRGQSVLCLHGVPERRNQDQTQSQTISSTSTAEATGLSSSEQDHLPTDSTHSDHQRAPQNQDSPLLEECLLSSSRPLENNNNNQTTNVNNREVLSDEERLEEAALNLEHVGDTSVPVILNIIGLESAKSENYEEAFPCFLAAAQQGYSKAQFNAGVCYEKGRGIRKDKEQALHYYRQASIGGHTQAQYRHAKLLLTSRGQQSKEELKTAIALLEKAAAAGLTKAQLCLASVYSQELVKDECKSVQYLKVAAESGDNTALLFLGHCFEKGFGVQQNPQTAIEYYTRAAKAGNKQAKNLLKNLLKSPDNRGGTVEDTLLRSIRSSPCFSVADHHFQQPLSSLTTATTSSNSHPITLPFLSHSWSTGSLCVPSTLPHHHLHLQSTKGGGCKWTVGIG